MAINALQPILREATGKELQFTGDFHAYWDQLGIPPGQFAERMAAWQNLPQNAAWLAAETWGSDGAFDVGDLWKAGEQGIYLDASDLSTMFQDAAGTLPVYAPGQGQVDPPVGRILDKSGRGNHATQATTTSRPTLSARYNLLTATESAAAWGKTQAGSGSPPVITENAAVSPTGTATAIRVKFSRGAGTTLGDYSLVVASISAMGAASTTRSVFMRSATGSNQQVVFYDSAQTVGRVVTVTPDWQQAFLYGGNPHVNSSIVIGSRGGAGYNTGGDTAPDIYLWGCDIRVSNDGVGLPPYQRVVDVNTYDTVGFPLYLRFDGVDDFLQTSSVDFSATDKVLVSAAVRKLSDAPHGAVCEFSPDGSANNGVFSIFAPIQAGVSYRFVSKGTLNAETGPTGLVAPHSAVISARGSVSGDVCVMRVNSAQVSSNPADQGTGNYGNYPLYIGRRAGTSQPFNGRLYGLLIRGAATPDATIAKVEKYLNQKARIY